MLSFLCPCSRVTRGRSYALITMTQPVAVQRLNSISRQMATIAPARDQWHKERVVILGSGWAGYVFSRKLDPKKFHVTIISPRSYFVFTPLLNDTTVGTLDFPQVVEPVRDRTSAVEFVQGWARQVDFKMRRVRVEGSVTESGVTEGAAIAGSAEQYSQDEGRSQKQIQQMVDDETIEVPYDKLVIAVGCNPQTFDTPGVKENALFLKDVGDARKIRRRILECFELAAAPNCPPDRRPHLLHFAVVGGGPTGMEFAGVLADLIHGDMMKVYPSLKGLASVTVYDVASDVLGMFDDALVKYAREKMQKQGVSVKTEHHIESLRWGEPNTPRPEKRDPKGPLTLKTTEQGEEGIGMCVWVTGNAMNPFVQRGLTTIEELREDDLNVQDQSERGVDNTTEWRIKKHEKTGALLIDDWLRVQLKTEDGSRASMRHVFAMGDNSMIESGAPPPTGETADQEAKWLAKAFNSGDINSYSKFEFSDKGLIAYVGDSGGLVQSNGDKSNPASNITGRAAYLAWRGSYWGGSISWRNRILILVYWTINGIFGRDISRF